MWDHFLSASQLDRDQLCRIFAEVESTTARQSHFFLEGRLVTCLFCEPSTRTARSFEAAVKRNGGQVLLVDDVRTTSVAKGESMADMIRTFNQYTDLIVLRHPTNGAAREAANVSEVPVINAGDGSNEHPTQALLDVYTIAKHHRKLDGLRITLVGDLKYGRTVHSLALLLSNFDVQINHVSPPQLRMPSNYPKGRQYDSLTPELLAETDVLYVTRIQRERFEEHDAVFDDGGGSFHQKAYSVTPEQVAHLSKRSCILHPFPRVDELDPAIDDDPRALYFQQMANGISVRTALMVLLFRGQNAGFVSDWYYQDPWGIRG